MDNRKVLFITFFFFLIITFAIGILAYYESKEQSELYYKEDKLKHSPQTDKRLIRVKGKLYYDTGKISQVSGRCGMMDGNITSHVDSKEIPTLDDQANFSGDYSYQFGIYNTIDVKIEKEYIVFKPLHQNIDFLDENFKIELLENEVKGIDRVEYYQNEEGSKIYLVGLDEVSLQDSNNKLALKEYIAKEGITINQAIDFVNSKMKYSKSFDDDETSIYVEETLYDGGTTISKYEEASQNKPRESKISNHSFKIIRCHTLEGNRDIYIGLSNLDADVGFRNGYCGK